MALVRIPSTDDWPLWRDIRLAALADAPRSFTSRLGDWHRGGEERWRARLTLPGARNLLAFLHGRPVGVASGLPVDGTTCELRSVWVSPAARGRGVGDLLVTEVETWARSSGATALRLTVVAGNEPAAALYRRHGFTRPEDAADLPSDGRSGQQLMTKRLR